MRPSSLCFVLAAAFSVLLCTQILLEVYLDSDTWNQTSDYKAEEDYLHLFSEITDPVVVWWEPLGGVYNDGRSKQCGQHSCYFTDNRNFFNHPQTKAFMFYGTSLNFIQLPLPRGDLLWALVHEESPRNNAPLSHAAVLSLFNYTATFSRFSSYPLTTQYLKDLNALIDLTYFVPTEEKNQHQRKGSLAPVMYLQSDCSTPLDRDSYVVELSKYIQIDSYGECLHNKDLPTHLQHPHGLDTMMAKDMLHLVAKYKFVLALENGICDDYITEKLWRPLISGSIPVYIGSPTVSDWLPNNKSAILGLDFASPKELAAFLNHLNNNDSAYNSYLEHKLKSSVTNSLLVKTLNERDWGIENFDEKGNFFENFGCFICQKIHSQEVSIASSNHYSCPMPISILSKAPNTSNFWLDSWFHGKCEAEVIRGEVSIASSNHYSCPMPISILSKAPNTSNFWLDSWFHGKCEAEVIRGFVDSRVAKFSQTDFEEALKRLVMNGKCQHSTKNVTW